MTPGLADDVRLVFSYGTLQDPHVQQEIFGAAVPGHRDALPGWRVQMLQITDPEVLRISGEAAHPIAVPSADPTSQIEGMALELTQAQFDAAVAYEVGDYELRDVVLRSGRTAGFFAARTQSPGH